MRREELRIGNYVKELTGTGREFFVVTDPNQAHFFEPIPLNEEWLLKMGFENWGIKELGQYEKEEQFALYNVIEGTSTFKCNLNISNYGGVVYEGWEIRIDDDSIYIKELKYLHQLQNLYFALTGEELTINL